VRRSQAAGRIPDAPREISRRLAQESEMKIFKFSVGAAIVLLALSVMVIGLFPNQVKAAAVSGDQILLNMRFVNAGVSAQGTNVLQTGQVSSMSPLIANTATKFASAPTSGGVYLRGLLVEKVSGGTSTVTVQTGTGTNCGTGTATLLGPITNLPIGRINLDIIATSAKDVCLVTDAAGTGVRALYQ
jgi:hypothetical protein